MFLLNIHFIITKFVDKWNQSFVIYEKNLIAKCQNNEKHSFINNIFLEKCKFCWKQKSIIRKSFGYRKSPTHLGEEETLKVRVSEKVTTPMGPKSVYQKKRVDPLPFFSQSCEGDEVRNLSRSYYRGYWYFEPSYTYYIKMIKYKISSYLILKRRWRQKIMSTYKFKLIFLSFSFGHSGILGGGGGGGFCSN